MGAKSCALLEGEYMGNFVEMVVLNQILIKRIGTIYRVHGEMKNRC